MLDEIVIKHDRKPGWPCPNCGGWGHMADGMLSIGLEETRIRPSTPCPVCKGSGRVLVTPIPKGA